MESTEPVPALSRGIAIMEYLSSVPSDSLDGITRVLDYPKSSTLRLLDTLCTLGLIERSESKTYRSLKHLVPVNIGDDRFEATLTAELKRLADITGETIEWYLPSQAGMTIIRQLRAEGEVAVLAKTGFIRHWEEELDSVAILGHAHSTYGPHDHSSHKAYIANGKRSDISATEANERIAEQGRSTKAVDPFFNQNGVRRLAMALVDDGKLRGVLSVATIYRFGREPADDFIFQELEQSVQNLTNY
ncbi:helix-turn-helix domain-containing protein [Rubellicoccus peritrichatus]|uniref:Helix-turn-helix domain-containing protein n=1 Tax=Rubellicoccus peritrichatus TaxID=3080537 RepID=A0AAQ3QWJ5_9BACT|nr:helix-turn-helix domain-containing protein [Puniceicoccus sp. CR14]WOO42783.1 helix-turn-helix domain-containing protein [Puniceicoccus sp. CR14]